MAVQPLVQIGEQVQPLKDVFKAIADPSRRLLLGRLNRSNGQSLGELCEGLEMARQWVSKHLTVLEAAGLVTTRRRGRQKLHHLNAAPIGQIVERWIDQYDVARAAALNALKHALGENQMGPTEFVYVTYIKTTPEELWAALIDPAFTQRYWGARLDSDWKVGSKVLWQGNGDPEPEDHDQVVLEADPSPSPSRGRVVRGRGSAGIRWASSAPVVGRGADPLDFGRGSSTAGPVAMQRSSSRPSQAQIRTRRSISGPMRDTPSVTRPAGAAVSCGCVDG